MAKPERIEYEGAYYHVINRGRGRQRVFHGEKYYESFLECLELAHKRFALEIHAYCLMGNHYHLLVRSPRGNYWHKPIAIHLPAFFFPFPPVRRMG